MGVIQEPVGINLVGKYIEREPARHGGTGLSGLAADRDRHMRRTAIIPVVPLTLILGPILVPVVPIVL